MAKQITQETFDDVVKENIQEFEMSVEEAISDAVQQFESQGVNLTMIIKDPTIFSNDGERVVHPVVEALNALSIAADKPDDQTTDEVEKHLDTVKQECDIDLSKRCFVGKNNAYPVLVASLKQYHTQTGRLIKTLETLCSLCNGQPDLLDDEGGELMMKIMSEKNPDVKVTELIVKLVRLNCIKHEANRQMFLKKGLIKHLVDILLNNKANAQVVKEVAFGLRVLTQDDDIRVPFGSAHENAKQIVIEGDALRQLLDVCKDYTCDVGVQGELFSTLSKLVVRDEFCQEVMSLGGLDLVMKTFQTNIQHKGIVKQALGLLKALAGNDGIKVAIVTAGGVQLILSAMTQHQGNPQVASAGCQTIATLVLRQPDHCGVVIENNGHHVILQAMKVHVNVEEVQKHACRAIRNVVARTREFCTAFVELGAEELINRARKFSGCEDEAKAALRDLGCEVDLKERWTGQRGALQQTA